MWCFHFRDLGLGMRAVNTSLSFLKSLLYCRLNICYVVASVVDKLGSDFLEVLFWLSTENTLTVIGCQPTVLWMVSSLLSYWSCLLWLVSLIVGVSDSVLNFRGVLRDVMGLLMVIIVPCLLVSSPGLALSLIELVSCEQDSGTLKIWCHTTEINFPFCATPTCLL